MEKVFKGTPNHDEHWCSTCEFQSISRGPKLSDEYAECQIFSRPIRFRVNFCNRYEDARLLSVRSMEDTAWFIVRDKKGNKRFVDRQRYLELESKKEIY